MQRIAYKIGFSFFLIALYLILTRVSHFISPHGFIDGVSLLWLPAFVRLFGSLVMGLWFIPVLFVMSLISYLEDNSLQGALLLALLVSLTVPCAIEIARRAVGVRKDLAGMSGRQLLHISIVCAAASSIAYSGAHFAQSSEWQFYQALATAFVGNFLGQWCVIYAIKAFLYAQDVVRPRL
ncbi:MAG: hypothetical protein EBS50_03305 [Sphingomonadaceae bacterium]|nr:hypothetical protein [Sphingomonadaceae bacterium]